MTPRQRHIEFRKLFADMSARDGYAATVTYIAELMHVSESTVRGWQVAKSTRIIPPGRLKTLQEHLMRLKVHL